MLLLGDRRAGALLKIALLGGLIGASFLTELRVLGLEPGTVFQMIGDAVRDLLPHSG